ncbi:hypothetical protein [Rhizobium sp. BK491]|uniref:hypothetical protein n=1 Tax=Rhizobium sp. BK491 TaxID=2587009 RepID=UPI00161A7F95|nr:hypothetical protein [Rhizobium sp. BK491]MBB3571575.1 hypothetical protein [Rhizobium sp. BK491]
MKFSVLIGAAFFTAISCSLFANTALADEINTENGVHTGDPHANPIVREIMQKHRDKFLTVFDACMQQSKERPDRSFGACQNEYLLLHEFSDLPRSIIASVETSPQPNIGTASFALVCTPKSITAAFSLRTSRDFPKAIVRYRVGQQPPKALTTLQVAKDRDFEIFRVNGEAVESFLNDLNQSEDGQFTAQFGGSETVTADFPIRNLASAVSDFRQVCESLANTSGH